MSIKEQKKTESTRFLVRGLGLGRVQLDKHGFINAYIDDVLHEPHYQRSVYLLFKPAELEGLEEFIGEQKFQTALLVEDYDYPRGYVVMVYNFPALYWKDYALFLKGAYSKFSEGYKSLFPKEKNGETKKGVPYTQPSFAAHVFNKSEVMRKYWEEKLDSYLGDDSEVWSAPNINKETLNINNI